MKINTKKDILLNRGFTLVETIIVMAVIGLLTGVILASASGARQKARDEKRITDMRSLQLAFALFYDVNKKYPGSLNSLPTELVAKKYISSIPTDPLASNPPYEYKGIDSNGDGINEGYCLGVKLERTNAIPADNVHGVPGKNCISKTPPNTSMANYKVRR